MARAARYWFVGLPLIPLALLILMLLRQTLFQRRRTINSYASVDLFNGTQLLLVAAAVVYLALRPNLLTQVMRRLRGSAALGIFIYYVFACTSALWSTRPIYSFYMATEVIMMLLTVFVLFACCSDFYRAEKLVVSLTLLSIGLEVGMSIYRGGLSLEALHTNSYSYSAAMLLAYAVGEVLGPGGSLRTPLRFAIVGGMLSLAVGTSTGSNIACFAGLCLIVAWAKGFRTKRLAITAGIALLAAGVVVMHESEWARIALGGKSLEAVKSGDHRQALWERAFRISSEARVFGYGFGVGPKEHMRLTNAHNSFLEAALNTGMLGVLLFGFALGKLAFELSRATGAKSAGSLGSLGAFAAGTINSLSLSVLAFSWTPPALSFYSFLALFTLFSRVSKAGESRCNPVVPRPRMPLAFPRRSWKDLRATG